MSGFEFIPATPMIEGQAISSCRAVVIVPARNEEDSLQASFDAFGEQVDVNGDPLPPNLFEVLLLLNNCTDASAQVAAQWHSRHPHIHLHVIHRTFPPGQAFVGTARRLLMDTAWHRLLRCREVCAILSTDSDTRVASDWIARNLKALEAGADAVGGVIALKQEEIAFLPPGVRRAYLRDRRYQHLVAELEHHLDPQQGDLWPRHLQHFGASLACTPDIYARAGGMPAVTPLEDVAFVERLRHIGARLRHDPHVLVYTSSRMHGRVEVGLSGQLLIWQKMSDQAQPHLVQSAAWLRHRFRTLARLRREAYQKSIPDADYLAQVDCDRIVSDTFRGTREAEITQTNRRLAAILLTLRSKSIAPAHPIDSPHAAAAQLPATPA